MSESLFEKYYETLDQAMNAINNRTFWSAYPEPPSGRIYGETAKDDGFAAYSARLNSPFNIDQPGTTGQVGDESSPFGNALGVTYPKANLDELFSAMNRAMESWSSASPKTRTGVCLEILHRLNKQSFQMANAVMHTTGQAFMMAFQAGGPHAQDRGLEAVAYAYDAMTQCPDRVTWSKQVSKTETITLEKRFRVMPRGVSAVIGCSTFPTWNGYPGLFASLVTGNAVVVKPHPLAILPLAITVEIARSVLTEEGFDPNVVTLLADTVSDPVTKDLATHAAISIIDYTGSSNFAEWIEQNAKHAQVYTEKAGVNSVILDSIDDMKAVSGNLAFSLCLYSGQMCTTPQNIFIPKDGIDVGGERKSFDDVAGAIVKAMDWLLGDPNRAVEILGAIQNERTVDRIEQAKSAGGDVLRESTAITHPAFPEARVHTPLIMKVNASQKDLYTHEAFGPIVYIIATQDTTESIALAADIAATQGAITCAAYSTDDKVLEAVESATSRVGVPLSCNLTGSIWVNQSAAFSDFHVSGANPSGNATLCDAAYVSNRFRIVQSRRPVTS